MTQEELHAAGERIPGPMTPVRFEKFLTSDVLFRISCLDDKGWPYVVPVWFDWDGSIFRIIALQSAAWLSYIAADARVGFVIDQVSPVQRVVGQGLATISEDDATSSNWLRVARRISDRYLGAGGPEHVEVIRHQSMRLVEIVPVNLVTWCESS